MAKKLRRRSSILISAILLIELLNPIHAFASEYAKVDAYFGDTSSASVSVGTLVERDITLPVADYGPNKPMIGDTQSATVTITAPEQSSITPVASDGHLDGAPLYSYISCNVLSLGTPPPPIFDALRANPVKANKQKSPLSFNYLRAMPPQETFNKFLTDSQCASQPIYVNVTSNPYADSNGIDTTSVSYSGGIATSTATLRFIRTQNSLLSLVVGKFRITPDVPGNYTVQISSKGLDGVTTVNSTFDISATAVAGAGQSPSNVAAVATSPTSARITFDEGAQKKFSPLGKLHRGINSKKCRRDFECN